MEITYCKRCIMNNYIDKNIKFDENGNCEYCNSAINRMETQWFPNEIGEKRLDQLLKKIKTEMKDKKYDCIMGLSGGLDSAYLLYLGHKWGLRILAIHIDDGFDTDISKDNLNKLVQKAGVDYVVVKPDQEQFYALTKAYMKAGLPNLAVPQDNVLFAYIYKQMVKYKIKYFLSGANLAGESIMENKLNYYPGDYVNIVDINKKFGTMPINKLEFFDYKKINIYKLIYKHEYLHPLDYVVYNRDEAFKKLEEFCGFKYYGSKHLENKLTAFLQLYWLPKKFGLDKRYAHLSSLILSNQITREKALLEIKNDPIEKELLKEYIEEIKSQIGINDLEFNQMMNGETRLHTDFKTAKDTFFYKARHIGRKGK